MSGINILMIHPHDVYSSNEPWTIRINSLAKEFVEKGHNVKLVYFPLPKTKRGKLRIPKIKEYETIPLNRRKWCLFKNTSRIIELGKWADIIHFQKCFSIASLPALLSSYINKKPIHYDWDDWEYGIYMWDPPSLLYGTYLKILENLIPRLVDSISVASDEIRNMAVNLGFSSDKIVKVNVCADLDKFNPNKKVNDLSEIYDIEKPVVLYLGQLHGAQYAELFIRSSKKVLKENPEVNFLVAGGGEDMERLKELTIRLKLDNKVKFTGLLTHDEVIDVINYSDIAVACFADTKQVRCKSPLKIAEYMASGKPIVASDVGEVTWMVGNTGLMTKPGDHDSLAEGIITLLDDKNLREKLSKNSRKRAEKIFKWETVADKLLKRYSELIH